MRCLIRFDIHGDVFLVDVETLIRPIKRPECEGKNNNFYKDHFFAKMIKYSLAKRNKTEDPCEIIAINVPIGNSNHFVVIFEYFRKCYNREKFKFEMPENKVALIRLLETVCLYEIHGLKIIILESINRCVDDELEKLRAPYVTGLM